VNDLKTNCNNCNTVTGTQLQAEKVKNEKGEKVKKVAQKFVDRNATAVSLHWISKPTAP